MVEKIRTCGRKGIDGGHNVVCDVGPNVAVLDVCFRSGDVASSYSDRVGSSSCRVSLTTKEFSTKNGSEEEEKEKSGEEKMKGYVCRSKGFIPMNLSNPKGEFFLCRRN